MLGTKQEEKKMICRTILLIAIFILPNIAIGADNQNQNNSLPIIETLTRNVDVTGDGTLDTIVLDLYGKNWETPFQWKLTIKDKDKAIFNYYSDDKYLDQFFADGVKDLECSEYLTCKKKYYENYILDHLIAIEDFSPDHEAYDKDYEGSIYVIAKKELIDVYHITDSQASKVIESMIRRLRKGKTLILNIAHSYVEDVDMKMYVPEVNGFVSIYSW